MAKLEQRSPSTTTFTTKSTFTGSIGGDVTEFVVRGNPFSVCQISRQSSIMHHKSLYTAESHPFSFHLAKKWRHCPQSWVLTQFLDASSHRYVRHGVVCILVRLSWFVKTAKKKKKKFLSISILHFCPRRNTIPTRTIIRGGWVSSSLSSSTLLKMG